MEQTENGNCPQRDYSFPSSGYHLLFLGVAIDFNPTSETIRNQSIGKGLNRVGR